MTKSGIFNHVCRAWRAVSRRLWCVLCMIAVLLVPSCRSINERTTIHRLDSLAWDRKASVTPAIIPPSRATLAVPVDSLRRLPAGAAYTEKSGQATVSLSYEDGNVVASARCDSLERLVFELSEQLYGKTEQTGQREEQKTAPAATFGQRLKWCLSGVLTGIILTIIIQIIYRLWQRKQRQSV
ncbi:hypothetical protein [Parabacteroides merdae]|uniref:hypothetical protein n=1 Tax=Parabacteroides merdae TaxID=46503 RepID=UPI002F9688E0